MNRKGRGKICKKNAFFFSMYTDLYLYPRCSFFYIQDNRLEEEGDWNEKNWKLYYLNVNEMDVLMVDKG